MLVVTGSTLCWVLFRNGGHEAGIDTGLDEVYESPPFPPKSSMFLFFFSSLKSLGNFSTLS